MHHHSSSDEEMIRQHLVTQPNQCFETLYNRYVGKVYRRCLSITRNRELAQDFTHDIFLKVFNKLPFFQQRSSFSTWLYAIAYNYCLDQLRVAKRLPFDPLDSALIQEVAEPETSRLREETLQLVSQAVEMLSVSEQALLRLKYEEGLSIETIAGLYSIKACAVKMRLKRSRDKIHLLYAQPDRFGESGHYPACHGIRP